MIDPAALAALRRRAEDATGSGDGTLAVSADLLLALIDERQSLRADLIRQEFDVVEELAPILGLDPDPAHRAVPLAQAVRAYCSDLSGSLQV